MPLSFGLGLINGWPSLRGGERSRTLVNGIPVCVPFSGLEALIFERLKLSESKKPKYPKIINKRFTSKNEAAHWTPVEVILKTNSEQNLNALFAEAHPHAVSAIIDKVDEQRVPGGQRLWVWGETEFLD